MWLQVDDRADLQAVGPGTQAGHGRAQAEVSRFSSGHRSSGSGQVFFYQIFFGPTPPPPPCATGGLGPIFLVFHALGVRAKCFSLVFFLPGSNPPPKPRDDQVPAPDHASVLRTKLYLTVVGRREPA